MGRFEIQENGIYVVFEVSAGGFMKLLHFSALPFHEEDIKAQIRRMDLDL